MTVLSGRVPTDWVEFAPSGGWEQLSAAGIIPANSTGVLVQCAGMQWALDPTLVGGSAAGFALAAGNTLRISNGADLAALCVAAWETVYLQFFTGPTGELPEIIQPGTGGGGGGGVTSVTGEAPIVCDGMTNVVVKVQPAMKGQFFIDQTNGNDLTALPFDPLHPYKTIAAAYTAAQTFADEPCFVLQSYNGDIADFGAPATYDLRGVGIINNFKATATVRMHGKGYFVNSMEMDAALSSILMLDVQGIFVLIIAVTSGPVSATIRVNSINTLKVLASATHLDLSGDVFSVNLDRDATLNIYGNASEITTVKDSRCVIYGDCGNAIAFDNSKLYVYGNVTDQLSHIDSGLSGFITVYGDLHLVSDTGAKSLIGEVYGNLYYPYNSSLLMTEICNITLHGRFINTPGVQSAIIIGDAFSTPRLVLMNALISAGSGNIAVEKAGPTLNADVFAYNAYTDGTLDPSLTIQGGSLTPGAALP